jgi:MOSC domain-containing protein YiiM
LYTKQDAAKETDGYKIKIKFLLRTESLNQITLKILHGGVSRQFHIVVRAEYAVFTQHAVIRGQLRFHKPVDLSVGQ